MVLSFLTVAEPGFLLFAMYELNHISLLPCIKTGSFTSSCLKIVSAMVTRTKICVISLVVGFWVERKLI